MKKIFYSLIISSISFGAFAQVYTDSTLNMSAKRVQFADIQQFAIGSYGEAHYNQTMNSGATNDGKMDLHRIITYLGYRFNDRLQFFSEIEFEHAAEVEVEQAFFNYRFNDKFNLKAGLILVPMGYVNEFHEPTLFNGVERPNVDKYVAPTTWSEMGAGFQGLFKKVNIKYQAYIVNGLKGYDGGALVSGQGGFRSARQGGDETYFRTPSFTGKVSYYGLQNLLIETSAYIGKTESTLYSGGIKNENTTSLIAADSSVLGMSMVGINFNYNLKGLSIRGEGLYTALSNTQQYNTFTSSNVANGILGYYGELAYTFNLSKDKNKYLNLTPFIRYENYDTHYSVDANIVKQKSYNREEITVGAGLWLAPGMIIKSDFQMVSNASTSDYKNILNVGFGYWF